MAVRLSMARLFCFGLGYSAQALVHRLSGSDWMMSGTNQTGAPVCACDMVWHFDGTSPVPAEALSDVTHILISVPPGEGGDLVVHFHRDELVRRAAQLRWI